MREFDTGATRDNDKPYDPEGFLSPLVLATFCRYMEKHRKQADGQLRSSDNWMRGIPRNEYWKSMMRHTFEAWAQHREDGVIDGDLLCAIMFNVQGYLFEQLHGR